MTFTEKSWTQYEHTKLRGGEIVLYEMVHSMAKK